MPLGSETTQNTISRSDSAELTAYIYGPDDTPVQTGELAAVNFTVRKPDNTDVAVPGAFQPDGSGFLRFTDTDQVGLYIWTAQFVFNSGEKRTYRDEFWVTDPLEVPPQTRANEIAEQVWFRVEDCFDSDAGGPWLREKTLAYFDPTKIEHFVPEGLMLINVWPPSTMLDLGYFTTPANDPDPALPANSMQADPDRILIVQATLVATIKHLMRSYTEQPLPTGGNVVYQDRRDYLQRWQSIYEMENQAFKEMVALWKRQFINYGRGSLLIHNKAGRLGYMQPGFRARNAARGYW